MISVNIGFAEIRAYYSYYALSKPDGSSLALLISYSSLSKDYIGSNSTIGLLLILGIFFPFSVEEFNGPALE